MKVDKQKFENVIRALLNAPPMPLSDIPRKRSPKGKAKTQQTKKRA